MGPRRSSPAAGLFLILMLGAAAGCQDSGVMDDSGFHASFSTDQPTPGAQDVDLSQKFSSGTTAGFDVRVTNTAGVQGAAFTLAYDPGPVRFASYAPGTALEDGGVTPLYSIVENSNGFVQVDIRRPVASGPAFITGTETLVRLNFELKKTGDSTAGFLPPDQALRQLTNAAGAAIPGVDWFGGIVHVE